MSAVTGPGRPELSQITFELPQQTVTAMELDADGFLWVGTLSGLARWDGYGTRTFAHVPGDATTLASNLVFQLALDGTGRMWVETEAGVQRFLGVTRGFGTVYPHGRLTRDGSGTVWVATPDALFRAVDGRLLMVTTLPPGLVLERGKAPRPLGNGSTGVWLTDSHAHVFRWDGSTWHRVPLPMPIQPNLTVVGQTRLWTVGRNDVWECVRATPRWRCQQLVQLADGVRPLTLVRGLGDTLWVGTSQGARRITLSTDTVERVPVGTKGNCPSHMVRSILVAPNGTTWLGTVTGIWRRVPYLPAFEFLGTADGLSGSFVTALAEDDRHHVWVGLYGGGVNEILPGGHIVVHRPAVDPSFDRIWAVLPTAAGRLWIGGDDGLAWLDPRRNVFHRIVLPRPHAAVTALAHSTNPRFLWIGRFQGGVLRLDRLTNRVTMVYPRHAPPTWDQPELSVRSLSFIAGRLWIGTDRGLFRLDPTTGTVLCVAGRPGTPPLAGPIVWHVFPARGGRLWIATDAGLDLLSPSDGTVRHVLVASEIPGATIYRIEPDANGWLWLSTNHGIARFDPRSGEETLYGRSEGVRIEEFNRGASCRYHDGSLAFGGNRGLVIVHPNRVPTVRRLKPPVVASLKVLGLRGWREVEPPRKGGTLTVDPGVRAIEMVLARPLPSGAKRTRYRFRVSERADAWINLGSGRSITLARMGSGVLHLDVQAAEPGGPWSHSCSLVVRFRPTFWERSEVRTGLTVLLTLLVGLAGWGLTVRRYRHRLELARAYHRLADERDRIARDLHDEIGAGLTSISFLTELLGRSPDQQEHKRHVADRIARTARRLLESLDSLIWAVDPRHDSMEELAASLREAAAEAIEAAGLTVAFDFPNPLPQIPLSGELRRTVLLILKEAVANAIRHGGTDRVLVRLEVSPLRLRLEVVDEGSGFDTNVVGTRGHGLRNMRARAYRVGGRLRIESSPGTGTRIALELPLAPDESQIPHTGDRPGAGKDA